MRYCHEMYGGAFKQQFGWYIKQNAFRLGVVPEMRDWEDTAFLPEKCPPELRVLLQARSEKRMELTSTLGNFMAEHGVEWMPGLAPMQVHGYKGFPLAVREGVRPLIREVRRLEAKVRKMIEDDVRLDFGFRKVGEGWLSESLLGLILEQIYPGEEIVRHHRPDWLYGLELDFHLPRLRLGVEYQGQQHFHPIKAWGGTSALEELRSRDALKRRLCKQEGVNLVEIDYTEPLAESHVRRRLIEAGALAPPAP